MTNKTKAELEVDISKLEKQIEELQQSGNEAMQTQIGDLQNQVRTLESERDEARNELESLKAHTVTLENAKSVAEREKAEADDKLAASREEVTKLTDYDMERETDFNNAKDRADKAEKALAENVEELTLLRHRNSELRQKIETMAVRGSTLHGHIDDLKSPY